MHSPKRPYLAIGTLAVFLCIAGPGARTAAVAEPQTAATETLLFDFEQESDLAAWSNIDVYALAAAEAKAQAAALARSATNPATLPAARPSPDKPKEPAVKIERSTENATSGKYSLKLTFAGGHYPTISTASPVEDWTAYKALHVDVTASRTCLVIFRATTQTSARGANYTDGTSRWEAAARLEPGRNSIVASAPVQARYKHVTTFEIYMYEPREGETIYVDNVRLSKQKPPAFTPFVDDVTLAPADKFAVAGADLKAAGVDDLADQFKGKWVKPPDKSVEQAEAEIRAEYEAVRMTHPRAVLAVFRDGQTGYDPASPEKRFAGWEDAGIYCHPPMAVTMVLMKNQASTADAEATFRFRPLFMRVDLSSIPPNANILSARLILVRSAELEPNRKPKPTMFVVEPCNRPWKENEVNVFEYAHDKFWHQFAGMIWDGPDADFSPVFLAHGPSGVNASTWDFTQAIRYWQGAKHVNHGFIRYGSPKYVDYLHVFTRNCKDAKNRPGVLVIYEPGA